LSTPHIPQAPGIISPGPQRHYALNEPVSAPASECDTELYLLGESELETGNPAGAAVLLERAIAVNPHIAVYHAQLGRARALLRQLADAIPAFRRAVALDPNSADYHFQFGLALCRSDDTAAAITALERAVELNPNHAASYYHLGRALHESGDLGSAIAQYERAVFFDSGLADAHNDLGSAFMQMGANNAAVACFRRAIELAPGLPEPHLNLGRALGGRGEALAAVNEFRKVVALQPAPGNWVELGNALAVYGDDEAVEICHRLARDRAGLKRLGADLYRDFLQLPLTEESIFIQGIRQLLFRAWTERCRMV
jgi:tetratricopeptide (TPR) repeat protein